MFYGLMPEIKVDWIGLDWIILMYVIQNHHNLLPDSVKLWYQIAKLDCSE